MLKRIALAIAAACLIAACGSQTVPSPGTGTSPVTGPLFTVPAPSPCPAGHATLGCSVVPTFGGVLNPKVPHGPLVPDVSMYQHSVNWGAVKTWQNAHGWKHPGGIFKLGETGYGIDPYAAENARKLHRNHMVAIGYWFVRPGATAAPIIAEAKATGVHLVVLDEEVSGIQGEAATLTRALKKAGFAVAVYHSAANVFDTSANGLGCWVASYGPATPPSCTTGKRIAWQMTDGHWGIPVNVPGIGYGDVSVSYGLLRLGIPPKPAVCWGKHAHPKSRRCRPIRSRYAKDVAHGKHWWKLARELRKAHS